MRPVVCRPLGALTVALILALIIACGGNTPDTGEEESGQVRGIVLEVVGSNIVELEILRIRDEAGKEWAFGAAEGFRGLSTSHLREHQLAGEPVLVTYVTQGSDLVAVDITD